jgi:hypothetical protein
MGMIALCFVTTTTTTATTSQIVRVKCRGGKLGFLKFWFLMVF